MAQETKSVKVLHGTLDDSPLRGGTLILQGVLDPLTLKNIKVDRYQREALPLTSLSKLMLGIKDGAVLPDIDIGMRGARTRGGGGKGEPWFLLDDCYAIDGQQRINACIASSMQCPEVPIRLGATIHFNTEYAWERERFRVLNADRIKVSPNVLLRNNRDDHPAIQSIYTYTDAANTAFCMAGRVSWGQNMRRTDLITALNFAKVVGRLHGHIRPGRTLSVDALSCQLDSLVDTIGPSLMRDNIRTFFNTLDEVWGVRLVNHKDLAPQLKGPFMHTLARLLSNHTDFWRNAAQARLFIDADVRRKLGGFKLRDPNVIPLTGSTGAASQMLYNLLVQHLNHGKRKDNHLTARPSADVQDPAVIPDIISEEAEAA